MPLLNPPRLPACLPSSLLCCKCSLESHRFLSCQTSDLCSLSSLPSDCRLHWTLVQPSPASSDSCLRGLCDLVSAQFSCPLSHCFHHSILSPFPPAPSNTQRPLFLSSLTLVCPSLLLTSTVLSKVLTSKCLTSDPFSQQIHSAVSPSAPGIAAWFLTRLPLCQTHYFPSKN